MTRCLVSLALAGLAAAATAHPTAPLPRVGRWVDTSRLERPCHSPDLKTNWPGRYPATDPRGFDVLDYDLDLTVNPGARTLGGTARLRLRLLEPPPEEVRLDLVQEMPAAAVRWNGSPAAFVQEGDSLLVTPPDGPAAGDTVEVGIDYAGRPPRHGIFLAGMMFRTHGDLTPDDPTDDGPIVANVNQPYSSHSWFPCKDHPADKASLRLAVTFPDSLTAVANGALVSEDTPSAGWRRRVYATPLPIATYLVSLAVSDFTVSKEDCPAAAGPLSLQYFVFPEDRAIADETFAPTCAMMQWLEDLCGPYPFPGEKYAQVEFKWVGAMENQTATHVAQAAVIAGARSHLLVVHELAHHWFGDSLTPVRWQDIWLNEGFARYCEALWLEHTEGPESFLDFMQSIGSRRWPDLFRGQGLLADPHPVLPNLLVYDKGAWVLHMLRAHIGDPAFFACLRDYAQRPDLILGSVTVADLVEVASLAAGEDLWGFFEPWLRTSQAPVLQTMWRQPNGGGGPVQVSITQLQSPLFTVTAPVRLTTETGTEDHWLRLNGKTTVAEWRPAGRVLKVEVDPERNWLLHDPAPVPLRVEPPRPNPSAGSVAVRFAVAEPATATIQVYDVRGRNLGRWTVNAETVSDSFAPDRPAVGLWTWDGRDAKGRRLAAGVYWLEIRAGGHRAVEKITLLR